MDSLINLSKEQLIAELEKLRLESNRVITNHKKTEEILREQTIELKKRNEELDAFSHTVAHDLKNPLANIIGFLGIIRDGHGELSREEILSLLTIICKDCNKSLRIIDSLLLFASVKQAELKTEELDMGLIISESMNNLSEMIKESQAEIILPEECPAAIGYAPWLEEVWTNYLNNAIKYGGRPPRIKIGVNTDSPNGMLRFWIRDNGQSISADNQKLLFKKFERLDQIKTDGHGLGLSIVRHIIEKLGGQVGVESETGKGSLFYFTLPQYMPPD